MARVEVQLSKGLKLEEQAQTIAVLRELTAGDIIAASEAAEKLVQTVDGPMLVKSPARMGIELLTRQIESIGDIPAPISVNMLGMLCEEDLALLQGKADELDDAVAEAVNNRGRDDPSGEGVDGHNTKHLS